MKNPQQIGRLIFLYIQHDLNFLQAWHLKRWRRMSEANELFFQRETSTDYIRERLRVHEQNMPLIQEKIQQMQPTEPAGPTQTAKVVPMKRGIVIRMLKYAAVFVGILFILGGGYVGYKMFVETASPRNFAMMISVNGQRILANDLQIGFTVGKRGIEAKSKGKNEVLFIIPNNKKSTSGQSDTLWSSDRWRFEMQMADKSDIWINLSSTISYPRNYNSSDSVSYYVNGEAFLKIPGNTNKHYKIKTDSLVIQATGAELDVRSGPDIPDPAVLLISGTASVETVRRSGESPQTLSLNPGQQARLVDGKLIVEEHPDINTIIDWKR